MPKKKIFAICGSTRKESVNLHIIKEMAAIYHHGFDWVIFNSLSELPHFNPDLDNEHPPAAVAAFRKEIETADGIMVCTPEYVYSLPGSLKNAFEWLVSTVLLTHKPTALITAASSGVKAYEALELLIGTIGAKIGPATSLLIQAPKTKITLEGKINDQKTLEAMEYLMKAFGNLIDQ